VRHGDKSFCFNIDEKQMEKLKHLFSSSVRVSLYIYIYIKRERKIVYFSFFSEKKIAILYVPINLLQIKINPLHIKINFTKMMKIHL